MINYKIGQKVVCIEDFNEKYTADTNFNIRFKKDEVYIINYVSDIYVHILENENNNKIGRNFTIQDNNYIKDKFNKTFTNLADIREIRINKILYGYDNNEC